jgi:hypothetical protein
VDGSVIAIARAARLVPWLGIALWAASISATDQVRVQGELKGIAIDRPDDPASGGWIVVGDRRIVVEGRQIIQLPGARMTLPEIFARAPVRCRENRESGLLATDRCRRPARVPSGSDAPRWTPEADTTPRTTIDPMPTDEPPVAVAQVTAALAPPRDHEREIDRLAVAIDIVLDPSDRSVQGAVTFVSNEAGYLRVGGAFNADRGGALVRLNDPDARQSVQSGLGCGGEGNCSPDARFRADPDRYTVRFETGYPACVPGGLGDACASSSRPVRGIVDAARLLPIQLGDHVTALGAFEVVGGVRVFWAHTLVDRASPVQPLQ